MDRSSFLSKLMLMAFLCALPAKAFQPSTDQSSELQRPSFGYHADHRVEFAFKDEAQVRLSGNDFHSELKWDYADVESILVKHSVMRLQRLFFDHNIESLAKLKLDGEQRTGKTLPDLNNWYTCVLESELAAQSLAKELAGNRHIRSASVTPIPMPMATDIPPTTPNYEPYQDYHDNAPYGVGIAHAWAESGGDGTGISIVHFEGGWVVDHEDYDLTYEGGGTYGWDDHGSACVSIMASRRAGNYGVTGLAYNQDSIMAYGIGSGPNGWITSSNLLEPGDVIEGSWGYGGSLPPGYSCSCNPGQAGSQPPESNSSDFDAIETVTANGRIVVVAAGNGCVPMDHSYYNNMYNLDYYDSGALIIGGIYPGGDPICYTNYGSRIDAHAWSTDVYSAGYGDLFSGGGDDRQYYTSDFGGTSSAGPIVAGSVAALQGVYKAANGGAVLDAWEMRNLLRTYGTPQASDAGTRPISNMPDLEELIAAIGGGGPDTTPPSINHTPLGNTGDTTGPYVVDATITDPSGVASATVYYRVDGGGWTTDAMSDLGGNDWQGEIPGQSIGSVIDYYISATDLADPPNTGTTSTYSFTILSSTNGIVLLTPSSSSHSSGSEWETELTNAGYAGVIMNVDNLDGIVLGEDVDVLVVLLGIYNNNTVLSDGGATALAIEDFVNAGGKVYMEGGDVWYWDPDHGGHDFNSLFGVSASSDGTGDLGTVIGYGPTSGSHSYSGENSYIDHLGSAGASLLFSNQSPSYNCGYYQDASRITVAGSFETAGLSGFGQVVADIFGPNLFDVLDSVSPPELEYSPASADGSADVGGSDSVPVSLQNVGGQTLDWTVSVEQDPMFASPGEQYDSLPLEKGEIDPRPGILPMDSGGPDAGGYVWIDSNEGGGPAVNFIDISGSGTELTMADDDNQGPFGLGFDFTFYGNTYNSVRICSNGFLSFTSSSDAYSNDPIPGGSEPNNIVAPMWDDFNPASGGTVYYQAFAGYFIVQWHQLPQYPSTGSFTFEAILYDDGRIEYQYGTLDGDLASATVGIENLDGSIATQVVYNAAYLASNMALLIEQQGTEVTWLTVDDNSGSIVPGGWDGFNILMSAAELSAGTYTGSVTINTNEPGTHVIPVTFNVGSGDVEGPVIGHSCLPDTYDEGPRTVNATITDESGVASATVVYSVDGGGDQYAAMSLIIGDIWAGTIAGQPGGSDVVYHIEAVDASPNANTSSSSDCYYSVLIQSVDAPVVSIEVLDPNNVMVSWDAVPDATAYRVYTSTDAYGSYTLLTETTDTFAVLPVVPDTVENIKVTAVNE